jgi:hypothetical protein
MIVMEAAGSRQLAMAVAGVFTKRSGRNTVEKSSKIPAKSLVISPGGEGKRVKSWKKCLLS